MATPDPDGVGLLAKVVGAAAAIFVPIGGAWKWLDSRLEKKADKEQVDKQFSDLTTELSIQRGHIAKLFDKVAESDAANEHRHRELLMHLLKGDR